MIHKAKKVLGYKYRAQMPGGTSGLVYDAATGRARVTLVLTYCGKEVDPSASFTWANSFDCPKCHEVLALELLAELP